MRLLGFFVLAFIASFNANGVAAQSTQEVAAKAQKQEKEREKIFNAERFMLDNGMEVIVVPNTRAPVVTHMVWYKVGAANEPTGKSGIAHFLEHLMFKGSKQIDGEPLAPGEFSKIVRSMGGNDNAFTSLDYTAYFQSVPSDKLEKVMRMEAGRMRGLQIPESEFKSEKKVVLEERKQRTDNDPESRFGEQLSAVAFVNHPYGTPVIGWEHEIEALSLDDAMHFYDQWYAPNNAVLVVSGDVTPAEVFSKAIDIYGKISKRDLPPRIYPTSPPAQAVTHMTMRDKAVRQPMVQTLYRVPSFKQNKQDALTLMVLEEIMGGGASSRLYQSLVVDQKITSSAGLSYDGSKWSDSSAWLYAVPLPETKPEAIEEALKSELRKIVKKGVSKDELKDAVTRMQDDSIYARDSLSGPAMVIGRALASGLSLDDVEYWPYDLDAITREEVQNVAAQYLNPDAPSQYPAVTGFLLPEAPAAKPAANDNAGRN